MEPVDSIERLSGLREFCHCNNFEQLLVEILLRLLIAVKKGIVLHDEKFFLIPGLGEQCIGELFIKTQQRIVKESDGPGDLVDLVKLLDGKDTHRRDKHHEYQIA
jgi:hypothetical protein